MVWGDAIPEIKTKARRTTALRYFKKRSKSCLRERALTYLKVWTRYFSAFDKTDNAEINIFVTR